MKRIVVSGAVLALAVAGVQAATAAPSVYKVTGGGQIIDLSTQSGAGDTIAFSAQSDGGAETADGSNAKGQFQYIDRIQDPETGKGTGKGQTVRHGEITCVTVTTFPSAEQGGVAVLGGKLTDGTPFRVDVMDDGQGADTLDLISVRLGDEAQDGGDEGDEGEDTALCDAEDEEPQAQLGRGNVKIHKQR